MLTPPASRRTALRDAARRVQSDPLVRNSFFLMATTATTAVMGFGFWLVVARLYAVEDVGRATSLMSVVTLLSYFSLVGLSSSLVRFLPGSPRASEQISSALITVTGSGVLVALLFVGIAPLTSPELQFVTDSWGSVLTFVGLATCAALNLLTDSVFVAFRCARYNLLINGVVMGAVKVALPWVFVSAGALGIFAASGIASAVAALASIWAIRSRLRIGLRFRVSVGLLRRTLGYSLGNYVSSCLNLIPLLVIPVVVLDRSGPAAAAAYFIAFQVATVVNAISYAVGESLFAEGSHAQEGLTVLMRRSARILAAVVTPAVGAVVLLAGPVLTVFGDAYAATASSTLIVLAVSAFAVAFNTWAGFLLKITGQLTAMIASEVAFGITTTVIAVIVAPHGPAWVAVAWGVGNLVGGLVAVVALMSHKSRWTVVAAGAVGGDAA